MRGGRREHHDGFAPASRGRRRASPVRLAGGLAGFRDHRHRDPGRPLQPALSGDAKPRRHRAWQRLYRGGGDRHVDGDRVRQYRYFCRFPDWCSRHYQRNAGGRGRADHSGLAHAARGRHPRHDAARRGDRLLTYSGDRGYAGDVVDPQGRPDQRHGRSMDHRPAAKLPSRRYRIVRDFADAGADHGGGDHSGRAVDALFGKRSRDLCHRRQCRSRAAVWRVAAAHGGDGIRAAWAVRRDRGAAVRDPAQGDPVDGTAQPGVDGDYRRGGRRRQHPRRCRHRCWIDAGGGLDRRNRQCAGLHQRLAVLASRRRGCGDPGHGGRRHPAAPAPSGGRIMRMAVLAPEVRSAAPRWLIRHETLLAAILVVALAIAFAIGVGGVAGFVNGLLITRVRVPPLIMTIATLALYRGLAEGISQARSVRNYPEWFFFTGQGEWLGVPVQLWILLVGIIMAGIALDRTTFGRTLYAIGNNETAARFSGLPVDRVKLVVYTLSGLAAGLSAWVLVSRVTTTRSDMGSGYELDVIAAVVLGGTSIFGGVGTIWGTVVGLVMIQLLKNGLALTGVKGDATIIVIGAVLIASTLIASSLHGRREVAG